MYSPRFYAFEEYDLKKSLAYGATGLHGLAVICGMLGSIFGRRARSAGHKKTRSGATAVESSELEVHRKRTGRSALCTGLYTQHSCKILQVHWSWKAICCQNINHVYNCFNQNSIRWLRHRPSLRFSSLRRKRQAEAVLPSSNASPSALSVAPSARSKTSGAARRRDAKAKAAAQQIELQPEVSEAAPRKQRWMRWTVVKLAKQSRKRNLIKDHWKARPSSRRLRMCDASCSSYWLFHVISFFQVPY